MTTTFDGAAVRIAGLAKSHGQVRAVDGLDLTIAPGEVVALLGPNGAGKSTTIDALLGLTRPDAGEVALFGRSPREAMTRGLVGAMLQSGGFPEDITPGELVRLSVALFPDPLSSAEVLRRTGIADVARQRFGRLSGGQKQRVRFAVALACNPDLLVLDEPTVAMDVAARREFWASMREFTADGRTVLFATHHLAEAEEFADRVVLLRAGRVVADGSVAQVRALASGRVVSAVVPGADAADLAALPGVTGVATIGPRTRLTCDDSDAALRALLASHAGAHDVEVTAHGLEDAFVALTAENADTVPEGV
ncbi:MAG: ABC transporter ATP-binding protein [Pseudonocardia sp.]|uniref:ABC transporter ATP-binding protein n=1 Tax=unclassified Pseudonocardia TaxID=2619320 RepID=UPI00086E0BB6|nr:MULTISPECIES: ABC transporter ATP-binding protein [unclassified Pseudonocardia]MBN9110603.1 ABC transporter ATP-binding protein [Pseudonocardia sp.]ODU24311.1 MAG: ABC transporter ATP-binding protein [Pseudonocardia sp. SCN 72-51]ODV04328.1 MAG: ABC transporter ATP-binding protein [Pseudonocardia sp. SCN 73-27]